MNPAGGSQRFKCRVASVMALRTAVSPTNSPGDPNVEWVRHRGTWVCSVAQTQPDDGTRSA